MGMTFRKGNRAVTVSGGLVPALLAALVLGGGTPAASENDAEPAAVLDSTSPALGTTVMAGDAGQGRRLYLQCRACHTLESGGENTVGPNLHGLFGSAAGTVGEFVYSDELMASGIVWSPDSLDQWLAAPSDFVPGNRMIFLGVADPQDRADLIAYLRQATAEPE